MGRILGRSPAEALGLSIADVTHPEDIAETRRFAASEATTATAL